MSCCVFVRVYFVFSVNCYRVAKGTLIWIWHSRQKKEVGLLVSFKASLDSAGFSSAWLRVIFPFVPVRFCTQHSGLCRLVRPAFGQRAPVRLRSVLRGVRLGPEPHTAHPHAHRQHRQLHQWQRGEHAWIQGTRGEHVNLSSGYYYSHGAAAGQSGGTRHTHVLRVVSRRSR